VDNCPRIAAATISLKCSAPAQAHLPKRKNRCLSGLEAVIAGDGKVRVVRKAPRYNGVLNIADVCGTVFASQRSLERYPWKGKNHLEIGMSLLLFKVF